jgi:hypothetical protein
VKATFLCYEDAADDDLTTEAMRAQLRAMYQWIENPAPGEPNVNIVCRPATPAPVMAKHVAAAASELQDTIRSRALDDIDKARERNAKYAIPGYTQLEVWPEHLARYV